MPLESSNEERKAVKSLHKPSVTLKETSNSILKLSSQRVIPGRLDAFYKKLGLKRLTPRPPPKRPEFLTPMSRRKSFIRVNRNGRFGGPRLNASLPSRNPKKRHRIECWSDSSSREKRKRTRSGFPTEKLISSN